MRRGELLRAFALALCIGMLVPMVGNAASAIRQLTVTEASNFRPAWRPDGKQIAFQSNRDGAYHIYVMDPDGGDVRQLSSGNIDDRHPAWSPDGRFLAVDSGDAVRREIWSIDVATRARTQVTRLNAITSFPSWSPDGKRISFFVYSAGVMDLWASGADGTNAQRLTRDLASEANQQCTFACHSASWSPRGDRLTFADGDSARVLIMSATSGVTPVAISPEGEHSHFPTYLSDGNIVYVTEHVSLDQAYTDLWTVDPDRSANRTEFLSNVQAQGPFELRGDGRELLFASPRSGNFEIYAVTLDNAGRTALASKVQPAAVIVVPTGAPREGSETAPNPLLTGNTPYAFGLSVLVLLLGGWEIVSRARRRRPPL